jgi:transposase
MTKVGIDISEGSFDAAIEISGKFRRGEFKDTRKGCSEFHKWLRKHDVTEPHLFMEATGRYWEPLATWAYKKGWRVTISNPRQVRKFAESTGQYNKTDPLDAECNLAFGQTCKPEKTRIWVPRSDTENELKELHMELEGVKKMITAERNRSRSGVRSTFVKEVIKENIARLKALQKSLERRALEVIKQDQKLFAAHKELKKVKGFGDKTIIVLLARVDFDQFRKGRQLVGFAGLAPRKWESGKSVRKRECISRVGHADLRGALFLPAIVAMTHDAEMAEYRKRLESSGKAGKTVICAVMARMLRKAFALVRNAKRAQSAPFQVAA